MQQSQCSNKSQNQDIFSRVCHKLQQYSFELKLLLVFWFSTKKTSNAKKAGVHKRQEKTDAFILKCYCFSIFKAIILLYMCKLRVLCCTAETKQTVIRIGLIHIFFAVILLKISMFQYYTPFYKNIIFWAEAGCSYKVYSYRKRV